MNMLSISSYAFDSAGLPFVVAGLLALGIGGAVLLYERFSRPSRLFFALAAAMTAWLLAFGLSYMAIERPLIMLWYRLGLGFVAVGTLLILGLALELTGRHRSRTTLVALWSAGLLLGASAAGPLPGGVWRVLRGEFLTGWAPLALAYVGFLTGVMGLVIHEFWKGYREAKSRLECQRHLLMLSAAAVSSAGLLDFFVPARLTLPSGVTPVTMLLALTIMGIAATRYRTFSTSARFGTDEVLRAMGDTVLVCDASGVVRVANAEATRLLEVDNAMLLGSHVGRWLRTADDDVPMREEDSLDSLLLVRDAQMVLLTGTGGRIDVSVSMEPITTTGERRGLVMVARDIRHRMKAERALQSAERRYRSLFWHTPGPAYEFDPEGRIVAVNPAAEQMVGMASADLHGRHFTDMLREDEVERSVEMFEAVLRGEPQEYELTLSVPGSGERQLRGVSIPVFEQGEVVGVFGVGLDMTDAARAKRELEMQRRYFVDLFESSPEGIVLIDAATDEVLRVNTEFTRMFGFGTEEVVGRKLNDLIVPERMSAQGLELNTVARDDGRIRTETLRQRKDGTLVEVSVLARKLVVPGAPEQVYGVYRDIGDRRETERRLKLREEELRHAQKLEAVGKLAGGIAHDFNNLLTVINGHARFALDAVAPGDSLQKDLLEIERAGMRAASLTQQLLAYSRRQVLHLESLDANGVVLEVQGMLRRLIGEHIRVETSLTTRSARVRADRGQLEQVLMNLVVNARDAMPDGGLLTLETDVLELTPGDDRVQLWSVDPGRFVTITVADSGIGMDPEILERAFEPFFTTKEQGKGTGLGLSTVFGIVKQSGGHVVASSQPGVGTTFEVILPRMAATTATTPDRAAPAAAPCPRGSVLVVEDEASVRNLAVRVLEREGCVVVSASNGKRALELIEAHPSQFELVVTDLVMPEMGGHELAQQLHLRYPDLPILFMSGYDEDLAAGTEAETAFLAKPFTPATLAARVAEMLSGVPADS